MCLAPHPQPPPTPPLQTVAGWGQPLTLRRGLKGHWIHRVNSTEGTRGGQKTRKREWPVLIKRPPKPPYATTRVQKIYTCGWRRSSARVEEINRQRGHHHHPRRWRPQENHTVHKSLISFRLFTIRVTPQQYHLSRRKRCKTAKKKKKRLMKLRPLLYYCIIPCEPSPPIVSLLTARTRIYLFLRVLAARERLTRPDTNQQTNQPTVFVSSVSSGSSIVVGAARKRRPKKGGVVGRPASQKKKNATSTNPHSAGSVRTVYRALPSFTKAIKCKAM